MLDPLTAADLAFASVTPLLLPTLTSALANDDADTGMGLFRSLIPCAGGKQFDVGDELRGGHASAQPGSSSLREPQRRRTLSGLSTGQKGVLSEGDAVAIKGRKRELSGSVHAQQLPPRQRTHLDESLEYERILEEERRMWEEKQKKSIMELAPQDRAKHYIYEPRFTAYDKGSWVHIDQHYANISFRHESDSDGQATHEDVPPVPKLPTSDANVSLPTSILDSRMEVAKSSSSKNADKRRRRKQAKDLPKNYLYYLLDINQSDQDVTQANNDSGYDSFRRSRQHGSISSQAGPSRIPFSSTKKSFLPVNSLNQLESDDDISVTLGDGLKLDDLELKQEKAIRSAKRLSKRMSQGVYKLAEIGNIQPTVEDIDEINVEPQVIDVDALSEEELEGGYKKDKTIEARLRDLEMRRKVSLQRRIAMNNAVTNRNPANNRKRRRNKKRRAHRASGQEFEKIRRQDGNSYPDDYQSYLEGTEPSSTGSSSFHDAQDSFISLHNNADSLVEPGPQYFDTTGVPFTRDLARRFGAGTYEEMLKEVEVYDHDTPDLVDASANQSSGTWFVDLTRDESAIFDESELQETINDQEARDRGWLYSPEDYERFWKEVDEVEDGEDEDDDIIYIRGATPPELRRSRAPSPEEDLVTKKPNVVRSYGARIVRPLIVDEWLQRAMERKESRDKLLEQASEAKKQGDVEAAAQFAHDAQLRHEEMCRYDDMASEKTFTTFNKGYDDSTVGGLRNLDLHGLTVQNALIRVKRHIAACQKLGVDESLVITGRGNHSPNHYPVIKFAVVQFLRRNNFAFKLGRGKASGSKAAGCLCIYFDRSPSPDCRNANKIPVAKKRTVYAKTQMNLFV